MERLYKKVLTVIVVGVFFFSNVAFAFRGNLEGFYSLRAKAVVERGRLSRFTGGSVINRGAVVKDGAVLEASGTGSIILEKGAHIQKGAEIRAADGETIIIGKKTVVLSDARLSGDISTGENCEVSGIISNYARLGNNVKVHRSDSNLKFVEVGDNVHINGSTLNGYGKSEDELVKVPGGEIETRIDNSHIYTVSKKESWSFIGAKDINKALDTTISQYLLRQYKVDVKSSVIEEGAQIVSANKIENTHIGRKVKVNSPTYVGHCEIAENAQVRPNSNFVLTHFGRKTNVGSEISKCWLGDGFVSEHQASYLSVIAPNEYLVVNEKGELAVVSLPNTTNIGAGTVFANYGGEPKSDLSASEKGTAFMWTGFTGINSNVLNKYSHPDVAFQDVINKRELTVVLPFSLTKGQVWGLVLPFTYADGLSPKTHKIGWTLERDAGMILNHLLKTRKLLSPDQMAAFDQLVEGNLRLGLYLIQLERGKPSDQRRWTDEQLDEGEAIYQLHLDSGVWRMVNGKFAEGGPDKGDWREEKGKWVNDHLLTRFSKDKLTSVETAILESDTYKQIAGIFNEVFGMSQNRFNQYVWDCAQRNRTSFGYELTGVLGLSDEQLLRFGTQRSKDRKSVHSNGVTLSGGEGSKLGRKLAKFLGLDFDTIIAVRDSGGGTGKIRYFNRIWIANNKGVTTEEQAIAQGLGFCPPGGADVGLATSAASSEIASQLLAERTPEKKDQLLGNNLSANIGVPIKDAFKSLFDAMKLSHEEVLNETMLVRVISSIITAAKLIDETYKDFPIHDKSPKILLKQSSQNILGWAIQLRSGFLTPQGINPKKADLVMAMWEETVGLSPNQGHCIWSSFTEGEFRIFYDGELEYRKEGDEVIIGNLESRGGQTAVPAKQIFTLSLDEKRNLTLVNGKGAPVEIGSPQFGPISPVLMAKILPVLRQKGKITVGIGEDQFGEEETIHNSRILAWDVHYPVPANRPTSPLQVREAVSSKSKGDVIILGPGSEGTSISVHLNELGITDVLLKAVENGAEIVIILNFSETNESLNLGPEGILNNYELALRANLEDESGRTSFKLEDLKPHIIINDSQHSLVTQEQIEKLSWDMYFNDKLKEKKRDEPDKEDEELIKSLASQTLKRKNRRPMPQNPEILKRLKDRFGFEHIHFAPYVAVVEETESSRGNISRTRLARHQLHRLAAAFLNIGLWQDKRDLILQEAVNQEAELLIERKEKQGIPTTVSVAEIKEMLSSYGLDATTEEISSVLTKKVFAMATQPLPTQPPQRTFGTVFNWGLLNNPALWMNTSSWLELLNDEGRAHEFLRQYYGDDAGLLEDRRQALISQTNFFVQRFGHQDVAIFRAPGRAMFIGQHTDRAGAMGDVNRYAVKGKEIFIIAKKNNDSSITIACPESRFLTAKQIEDFNVTFDLVGNLYQTYPQLLADNYTELSGAADSWDVVAKKIETDLNAVTSKSPRHFLSGAAFLINNHFRKKTNSTRPVITRGIDFVIEGNIPPGIGISSSSATVISTAMALCAANGAEVVESNADPFKKQITFKELCDLIGYGEWIVGTRGGTGDHAVIIFGHEGGIINVGIDHREVLDLPKGMTIALMNTPPRDYDEATKTITPQAAKRADEITVNRVISYNLALVFLREFGGPKFRGIKNLIDIFDPARNISDVEIVEAFKKVPDYISRQELQAVTGISPEGAEAIRNIIQDKPREGLAEGPWRARAVGLSMATDLKRSSIVFPMVLKDATMPDGQKRDLLFQMAETSMIGQRMEDNYGPTDIAPWKNPVTDADLDMAIQGIQQGQDNPYNNKPWSLINLTGLESYGVASWHQSMLHKYIKDRLAQDGLDPGNFTGFMQGAGLGGAILAVIDPSIKDKVMEYYREYATRNFSAEYELWLDVPAGRGAEALVYLGKKEEGIQTGQQTIGLKQHAIVAENIGSAI